MRLFEHADFEQAILRAAEYFRERELRPAIIEKDYYVTEALRIIAGAGADRIIFKGGTSLSKGWNLIDRFSEDVDIFLDPEAFAPPLGKRAIDRQLKALRDAVAAHPALTFLPDESRTIGGFGRQEHASVADCSLLCYTCHMQVRSFAHKGLRRLYEEDSSRGLSADAVAKLRKMLAFLDAMRGPEELRFFPTWKAHVLTGDRKGTWSLSVTRNRRLTFRIEDDEIIELDLEDYH